tara:strand:+ start:3606 stop:4688 length:1083 start_codon:yes stop_codon:yes gene_type:complete
MESFDIDEEWDNFLDDSDKFEDDITNETVDSSVKIVCSPLYISTKTKIAFLNTTVNIPELFWKIPIIPYYKPSNGVIKKQVKMTCLSHEETNELNNKARKEFNCEQTVISHLDNPMSKAIVKYKHVEKVSVGTCKKDFVSYRTRKKGAFYNCFALIFRIKFENEYKEVHIKVFNTGKLEIPGIQDNKLMYIAFNMLIDMLQPHFDTKLYIDNDKIDTVLINSNFKCGYYINRQKLFEKLKYKYGLISMFDPCSYPGIQSKFYFNKNKEIQDGICQCTTRCNKKGSGCGDGNCKEISFMIFRTGSALIVGNCDENILYIIYDFIKKILEDNYLEINDGIIRDCDKKKSTKKKVRIHKINID